MSLLNSFYKFSSRGDVSLAHSDGQLYRLLGPLHVPNIQAIPYFGVSKSCKARGKKFRGIHGNFCSTRRVHCPVFC